MAATPQNGTIRLLGVRSGRQYSISIYISDVAAAFVTFSLVGKAASTSVNFLTAPEDVVLADVSIVTGTADTTTLVPWSNDSPIPGGKLIPYAQVLTTIQTRSFPNVGWKSGSKIQFAQA